MFSDIASQRSDFDIRTNKWIPGKGATPALETPGVVVIKEAPTPQLTACTFHQLHEFYQRVRTLHASGVVCNVRRWIIGADVKEKLYWLLFFENVWSDSEFEFVLDDVDRFIEKLTLYFTKVKNPVGEQSDRVKVMV